MDRKRILAAITAAHLAALWIVTPPAAGSAAAGAFDWQAHKGKSIRVLTYSTGWSNFIKPLIPDFEKQTGIRVEYEIVPGAATAAFNQRLNTEFMARTGAIDVFFSYAPQFSIKFFKAGWYEPLDAYVRNPTLTAPGYDFADFTKSSIESSTVDGTLVGMPVVSTVSMLYYRTDLFKKYGVSVPRTFNDLAAAAKALHKKEEGLSGIVYRGRGRDAVSIYASFLAGMGGRWFDKNGQPLLDTPEAIEAFKLYGRLLADYGPLGGTNIARLDGQNLFTSGRAAMWLEATDGVPEMIDPSKVPISDKIGYAMFPAGKAGSKPMAYSSYLAISPQSKNKPAAWLFVQWASGKEVLAKGQAKSVFSPRKSSWQSEEYMTSRAAKHPDLTEVFLESLQVGTVEWLPPIEQSQEVRDAIGTVITTAIQGGDVLAAAKKANAETRQIVSR